MRTVTILSLTWMLAGCVLAQASTTPPTQKAKPAAKQPSDAAALDLILTRLEKRGDGLKDIRCRVIYVEDVPMNMTKRTKYGTILLQMAQPNPRFLIHFEKTEMDDLVGMQEWYYFDGRWMYQVIERIRQVTKYEVASEGESFDMFDIEKAPFPLPFGQKKDKMLASFSITLVPPAKNDPPNTDHLVCIPRPTSRLHGKYDKVEFYVLRGLHLPSRVVVTKHDGEEINTANFPDLSAKSINTGVTKKDFAAPAAWKNYDVVVEEALKTRG